MAAPYTLAEWKELHPWPKEHGARPEIEYLWHFDVAMEPDELWRFVEFGKGRAYSDNQAEQMATETGVFRDFDAWVDAFAAFVKASGRLYGFFDFCDTEGNSAGATGGALPHRSGPASGRAQPPFFLPVGCCTGAIPLPPRFFTAPRIVTTWFFGPGTGPSMRMRLSSGRSFAILRLSALTVSSP